jgi:hypothetical protein
VQRLMRVSQVQCMLMRVLDQRLSFLFVPILPEAAMASPADKEALRKCRVFG